MVAQVKYHHLPAILQEASEGLASQEAPSASPSWWALFLGLGAICAGFCLIFAPRLMWDYFTD